MNDVSAMWLSARKRHQQKRARRNRLIWTAAMGVSLGVILACLVR